jgi:hypothetical protein
VTAERWYWGSLIAVVVASVIVVAVAFTPVPHTGGDNAGYIGLAHGIVTSGSYSDAFDPEGLPHTKYPPVFPGLLALLIVMGARTWVTLKLTAAVSTVVAVGFTYLWAERSLGILAAGAVATVFGLSSGVIYYSHWILSDPVFVALTVTGLFALARADEEGAHFAWLIAGVSAAGLANFTRSAGLPLVVAVLVWLGLRRRWRALAVTSIALGLPMLGWWLRGRGEGVAQYGAEFWMVDPYQPALGTIGVLELIPRLLNNLSSYVFNHIPAGVVGLDGSALPQLGVVLCMGAVVGWVLRVGERVGPVEVFFPLYAGLILLWPEVWGGDRFALPLYPVIFVYGAGAVRALADRVPQPIGRLGVVGVLLLLVIPAGVNWLDGARESSVCAEMGERDDWACYGPRVGYFVAAARWAGTALPPGSAVLSRKPRHFYLLSGHPSRAFHFGEEPADHLELADALDARYLLLDQWDGLAVRYAGSAVRRQPGAFCFVRGFGQPGDGGAQLLGILDPDQRSAAEPSEGPGIQIATCPSDFTTGGVETPDYPSSGLIPLLEELDS